MPRVPLETAPLAPLQLPRMNAGYQPSGLEYVGRGLENVATTVRQIQDASDTSATALSVAKGQARFNDILVANNAKISDPNQWNEQVPAQLDEAFQQLLEETPNPRVKQAVHNRLIGTYESSKTKSTALFFEKKQGKAKDDFAEAGEQMVNSLAKARTQENRDQIKTMFDDMVDSLRASNTLTPVQAGAAKRKFTEEGEKARAEYMRVVNPEGLKKALAGGEFPNLDAYVWEQRANETIRENDQAVKKLEKERVDAIDKNLLADMETSKSLTAFKSKILGMKDDLPADTYRFWIDRANRAIDDQQRDIERAEIKVERAEAKREREADRREARADRAERRADRAWNTSSGAIQSEVIRGLILEPEKWDQKKILSLMGPDQNGRPRLGIGDTQQAVRVFEQITKDPLAKNLQPLPQAIKNLEDYHKQQLFIPKEARGKPAEMDPEEILINNNKHQEILRKVIQRSSAGEDPQMVVNELMQPHFEEAVKTWFERLVPIPGLPQGAETRRNERVEARQRLVQQGHEVTEANIQKAIEIIKKSRARP